MSTTAAAPRKKIGRLERPALMGVLVREVINFSSFWKSSVFSSTVEPTIYLLAFGFGFGTLVTTVAGLDYVQFVGTGTVATAVLFSSVFSAMFGSFVKYQFQRTYDAILAAPVDTEELVTAEALWIAARAGVFGCAPLLVAMVFGLDPSWGMLLVPFIGMLTGYGWACFGIIIAAVLNSIDHFSYITSTVVTPMFLPPARSSRSPACRSGRRCSPSSTRSTTACELVRGAVFGFDGWVDVYHLGFLFVFAFVTWRAAIHYMAKKLVD